MGMIRKTMSLGTGGLVNYRNTRESLARSARVKAKAEAGLAREQAKLVRAERQALEHDQQDTSDLPWWRQPTVGQAITKYRARDHDQQLSQLDRAHADGQLTDVEYEQARRQLDA